MGCGNSKQNNKNPKSKKSLKVSTKSQNKTEVKIVLLGDQAVGKSSIAQQFCLEKFDTLYKATIGGAYLQKEVALKSGEILKLHVWDTSGQERFRAMTSLYYKGAAGAILTYDITNKESLEKLGYWIEQLKNEIEEENFVFTLAGNKMDLEDKRMVNFQEGKKFASDHDIPIFCETSAKTGMGIKDLFQQMAEKIGEGLKKNQTP